MRSNSPFADGRRVGPLLVPILLAACTSAGRLDVIEAPAQPAPPRTLIVVAASGAGEASKEAAQLEATVAMIARQELGLRQVSTGRQPGQEPADLRVEARISRLDRVTARSRTRRGIFAGRARLRVEVTVLETATGAVLGRSAVEGTSSWKGTTEQAIRRASERIVTFLACPKSRPEPAISRPAG